MVLVDLANLESIEATSAGIIKLKEKNSLDVYRAVSGPIKIKFAPDYLVVVKLEEDESGRNVLSVSSLLSSSRKFGEQNVLAKFNKRVIYGPFSKSIRVNKIAN